ncbi:MAG: hypothetical protein ACQGVC_18040 [Myxococcota bacterium]
MGTKKDDQESAVALYSPADLPVPMGDIESHGDDGLEEATAADIAIPFIRIVQSTSPQVKPTEGEYNPDARPGMLVNVVTRELFDPTPDRPFGMVHCYFRKEVLEWGLREKGGGLRNRFRPEEAASLLEKCTRDEKNRDVMPGGETHLELTGQHYILTADGEPAVIALSRTQHKKSRQWNSLIESWRLTHDGRKIKPKGYARFYEAVTVPEKNDQGDWYGWKITPGPFVTAELYAKAKAFHDLVAEDAVRIVDVEPADADAGMSEAHPDAA